MSTKAMDTEQSVCAQEVLVNGAEGAAKKTRLIDLGSVEVETRGSAGGTPDAPSPGHD